MYFIDGARMFKIKSISQMEQELLAMSKTEDIVCQPESRVDIQKQIPADQVKKDVAILARLLINVYCGWPFHDKIVKRKVLKKLLSIYNNAHDMTPTDLFNKLADVVAIIPDEHICLRFYKSQARYNSGRKNKNVGKNLAGANTLVTELRPDNVAVIAFHRMYRDDWVEKQLLAFKESLDKSSALIVDLRGNGGGNSKYSDNLAEYLYGGDIRSAKKTFVRNNPDAARFLPMARPDGAWWQNKIKGNTDPLSCGEEPLVSFNAKKGYNKPIYILTDCRTGSSSEMFLLRMIHHPLVKVVGDNSRGMEVYGNVGWAYLTSSNIIVGIGMNYRELEFDNFESKGYKPDIMCKDGQDAFEVAMADLSKQSMLLRGGIEK